MEPADRPVELRPGSDRRQVDDRRPPNLSQAASRSADRSSLEARQATKGDSTQVRRYFVEVT